MAEGQLALKAKGALTTLTCGNSISERSLDRRLTRWVTWVSERFALPGSQAVVSVTIRDLWWLEVACMAEGGRPRRPAVMWRPPSPGRLSGDHRWESTAPTSFRCAFA